MGKTFEQQVTFNATPQQVFEALMDSKKHSEFTGDRAVVSREVGGAFSCHDGMVSGINVELVPGERIVQAWRAKPFPPGAYTIASFELKAASGGKTALSFTQEGVPEPAYDMIAKGWSENYWEPLKKYLSK